MRERRVQATKELEVRRAAFNVHSCSLLAFAQSVARQPAGRLRSHLLQRHLLSFWLCRMSPLTMTKQSKSHPDKPCVVCITASTRPAHVLVPPAGKVRDIGGREGPPS